MSRVDRRQVRALGSSISTREDMNEASETPAARGRHRRTDGRRHGVNGEPRLPNPWIASAPAVGRSSDPSRPQQWLKAVNRMSIVRHLCATPGLSRADLASATGLTKSTVTLLVREL